MLSKSVEKRALELIIEKNLDIIEAVKQALVEDTNFASEMIEQRTERAKEAKEVVFNRVYDKIK